MRSLLLLAALTLLLASGCQQPKAEPSVASAQAPLVASPQLTFGPVVITPAPGVQRNASSSYAPLSGMYLVVWEDFRSPLTLHPAIYAARLTADGGVLDPLGLPLSTRPVEKGNPVVTNDSTDFLVAWEESNGTTTDIIGTRVTAAGQVLDPDGLPLLVEPGVNQRNPALINQAFTYFVMARSVGVSTSVFSGAQVRRDGTTLTGPLSLNGVDEVVLATAGWTSAPPLRAPRAAGWHVTWRPGGSTCMSSSECQSGSCGVGGLCAPVDAGVMQPVDAGGTLMAARPRMLVQASMRARRPTRGWSMEAWSMEAWSMEARLLTAASLPLRRTSRWGARAARRRFRSS